MTLEITENHHVIMQAMNSNTQKWISGLNRTRKSTFGKIATFFGASDINADTWEELENIFIQSDLGFETTQGVINQVQSRTSKAGILKTNQLQEILIDELKNRLTKPALPDWGDDLKVILITGVNGSGKTTTIAKLGHFYAARDKTVLFIAADTFRAAATEQLQDWGERLKIPVITGQKGGDPGAVVYDGIQSALSKGIDLVIIDTAGRLHTSYNLMEELKKVHRVAGKALPGAPHVSWLVLDATTGQNALHQASSFQETIPLDGIILAKLDSSSKGGMAFAIQEKLNLPIIFAGLGENPADLVPFDPEEFVSGILSNK
jgi:fused signal recognition particle receptor